MNTPIEALEAKAQALAEQEKPSKALLKLTKGETPTLKHYRLFIARHFGFKNWEQAEQVLSGDSCNDYGGLWYKNQCAFMLNDWCVSYEEAKELQHKKGGVLLPYKHQFMVVGKQFLNFLGMNADDPQWAEIDNDWLNGPLEVRLSLALKRIEAG